MRKIYIEQGESFEICIVPEGEPKTAKGFKDAYDMSIRESEHFKWLVNVASDKFAFLTSLGGREVTSRGTQMILRDKQNRENSHEAERS